MCLGTRDAKRLTESLYLAVERNSILRVHIAQTKARIELQEAGLTQLFSQRDDDKARIGHINFQYKALRDAITRCTEQHSAAQLTLQRQEALENQALLEKEEIIETIHTINHKIIHANTEQKQNGEKSESLRVANAANEEALVKLREEVEALRIQSEKLAHKVTVAEQNHAKCPDDIVKLRNNINEVDQKWEAKMNSIKKEHEELIVKHSDCPQTLSELTEEKNSEKVVLQTLVRRFEQTKKTVEDIDKEIIWLDVQKVQLARELEGSRPSTSTNRGAKQFDFDPYADDDLATPRTPQESPLNSHRSNHSGHSAHTPIGTPRSVGTPRSRPQSARNRPQSASLAPRLPDLSDMSELSDSDSEEIWETGDDRPDIEPMERTYF